MRQMIIPEIGEKGQEKLQQSTVGVMGVGGLGSPASTYLAAAGVGEIILADLQSPDITNLNRQILHWDEDIGIRTKTSSAAWKLRRYNPEVEIVEKTVEVKESNISTVFRDADIILDCLDNFPTRYLLNEHCLEHNIPLIHAAVEGWHGQVTTIVPGKGPCLRCLFPSAPKKNVTFPILGVTAGVFGCLEANEAIKLITGAGEPLISKLLVGDLNANTWDTIDVVKAENCPACKNDGKED
jgi:molybdopterin/thiamine biosynthesis adenylyltransferase